MLDIKFIRENPELVKDAARKKGVDEKIIDKLLKVDQKRRQLIQKTENLRSEQKKTQDRQKAAQIKDEFKFISKELSEIKEEFTGLLESIPNIPSQDTPVGKDETKNKVLRSWGEIRKFDFKLRDHLELGQTLDIIDVEKASQVSGSRFNYLKGSGAILEFALIQHALNILTNEKILKSIAQRISPTLSSKPFVPVVPPVMIKPDVFQKMARLEPKEERYYLAKDDLYLIGSAEHTLGPLHLNETLAEESLPLRYLGFSTSFRREAGSYGKDTRGILRVHQFDKLEMEVFSLPENSSKEQDFIVALQEYLMQSLEIPYQVVIICTGDMAAPDARQIDIEAWLPGQNKYRETHTADLMTDYQARRLNTKVKRNNGQSEFVHMNDATAFAIGRTIIAILENYQQKDGSVKIPKVLEKYTGFKEIK